MFAVIPAHNEEQRILKSIQNVRRAGVANIIVVANGCDDRTRETVRNAGCDGLTLLSFRERLGVDVPRAVGAAYAYRQGASHVLFYDGDLIGSHQDELAKMVASALRFDIDLGLTDVYGTAHDLDLHRDLHLKLRSQLNHKLGLVGRIGLSSPAHGPHIVSRRLLDAMPASDLALPPLSIAHAKRQRLRIDTLAHIPHARLGSAHRGPDHFQLIRDTMIGDLLEAINLVDNLPRKRIHRGTLYEGYHPDRRFDLFERFVKTLH